MSAYLIFTREATLDSVELAIYSQQAPATLEGQPVKVLAFYGQQQVLEGSDSEGVVILEFPALRPPALGTIAPPTKPRASTGLKGQSIAFCWWRGSKTTANIFNELSHVVEGRALTIA